MAEDSDGKYLLWAQLLANDNYSRRLMAAAEYPTVTQDLAAITDIPIAVAYRRVAVLAEVGLLIGTPTHVKRLPNNIVRSATAYRSVLDKFSMSVDLKSPPTAHLEFRLRGTEMPILSDFSLDLLKYSPGQRSVASDRYQRGNEPVI